MRALKWLVGTFGLYVIFVVIFEAGYLGWMQPSFEGAGVPMLKLTTTGESGGRNERMLAGFETDGKLYISAHHWPRGWYHRAKAHPNVEVELEGARADYVAVPVTGAEFDHVAATHPLSFVVRLLMGFPPEREILRLDRRQGSPD